MTELLPTVGQRMESVMLKMLWKRVLKWREDRMERKILRSINRRYSRSVRKNRVITSWRIGDE